MSDAFISYAREDRPHAELIATALQDAGLVVFWDPLIEAGRTFERVIEDEIARTGAVIVLWSQGSIDSDWVRAEAAEGARRGILVPVSIDGSEPPLRYRMAQTADLCSHEPEARNAVISHIVQRVKSLSETERPATGHVGDVSVPIKSSGGSGDAGRRPPSTLHLALTASLVAAWVGSISLSVALVLDYRLASANTAVHTTAIGVTYAALAAGGAATAAFGYMSLRRNFVPGILQGWLWPVLVAAGQLLLLIGGRQVVGSLPFVGSIEAVVTFMLIGCIGPSLLTVAAVVTKRALIQNELASS